jgi:hypothetical protein
MSSPALPEQPATVKIGDETINSFDVIAAGDKAKGLTAAFEKSANIALHDGGYPLNRGAIKVPDAKLDAFIAANPELEAECRGNPRRHQGYDACRQAGRRQASDGR